MKEEGFPKNEDELKEKILEELILSGSLPNYFVGRFNKENIIIFHNLSETEASKVAKREVNQRK